MNTSSAEFLATKANKDTTNTNLVEAPPEMIGAEMLVHALHKEGFVISRGGKISII